MKWKRFQKKSVDEMEKRRSGVKQEANGLGDGDVCEEMSDKIDVIR